VGSNDNIKGCIIHYIFTFFLNIVCMAWWWSTLNKTCSYWIQTQLCWTEPCNCLSLLCGWFVFKMSRKLLLHKVSWFCIIHHILQPGFGNLTAGCVACSCDPIGSLSEECDPISGNCKCRSGIGSARCEKCEEMHFGFSPSGCQSEYSHSMPVLFNEHVIMDSTLVGTYLGFCIVECLKCILWCMTLINL
jgi:hypothetical protein